MTEHLVILGLGYTGRAVAEAALAAGFRVSGSTRNPDVPAGVTRLDFCQSGPAIESASHLLVTAAPDEGGDPVLARFAGAVAAARGLRWLGYLSTTGVYGDRGGAWVEETTPPAPTQSRSVQRLAAEQGWEAALAGRPVALDLFRIAGIYGPGRNVLQDLRAGRARRLDKPGHAFSRIHRDDIARAVLAAALAPAEGRRVLHLADDLPAPTADVVAEGARLLGLPVPPLTPFAEAELSPMGRSFWAENRKVSSRATQAMLGIAWRYPSYREGLAALAGGAAGSSA